MFLLFLFKNHYNTANLTNRFFFNNYVFHFFWVLNKKEFWKITDELILKNYYDTVFNSKEYTEKVSLEKLIENTKKQVKSNKIKRIIFSIILIITIVYFIGNIPSIFFLGKYFTEVDFTSLIIIMTSVSPIFFCFILIILFSILGKKANRKYKEMSIRLKEYQDSYDKVDFAFTELAMFRKSIGKF